MLSKNLRQQEHEKKRRRRVVGRITYERAAMARPISSETAMSPKGSLLLVEEACDTTSTDTECMNIGHCSTYRCARLACKSTRNSGQAGLELRCSFTRGS